MIVYKWNWIFYVDFYKKFVHEKTKTLPVYKVLSQALMDSCIFTNFFKIGKDIA